jgi:hypothetical protein
LQLLFGLIILSLSVNAQAAFQESLWGARPASMAGVFTALADDANAPSYNPAGIALLQRTEVTLMYAQLFSGLELHAGEDTSKLGLGYLSYVPQIREQRYGSYAFSWTNFVASNLYREDSFSLTVADSYVFDRPTSHPVVAYGASLKLLRRAFSRDSRTDADPVFKSGGASDALTGDVGLIVRPDFAILPGLKMGLAVQNVTNPDLGLAKEDRVPSRTTFGLAYQDLNYKWFNPAIDISHRNGKTIVGAGWEGWFAKNTLAFRAGGDETQLAGGIGYQFMLKATAFRLDYAILWPLQVDGTNGSHRVSLTTSF